MVRITVNYNKVYDIIPEQTLVDYEVDLDESNVSDFFNSFDYINVHSVQLNVIE